MREAGSPLGDRVRDASTLVQATDVTQAVLRTLPERPWGAALTRGFASLRESEIHTVGKQLC
jgi:hypothetical protein